MDEGVFLCVAQGLGADPFQPETDTVRRQNFGDWTQADQVKFVVLLPGALVICRGDKGGCPVCAQGFGQRGLGWQFGQFLPPDIFVGAVGDGHAPNAVLQAGARHLFADCVRALTGCNLLEFGDRHIQTAVAEAVGQLDGFAERDVDAQSSGAEVRVHGFLLAGAGGVSLQIVFKRSILNCSYLRQGAGRLWCCRSLIVDHWFSALQPQAGGDTKETGEGNEQKYLLVGLYDR